MQKWLTAQQPKEVVSVLFGIIDDQVELFQGHHGAGMLDIYPATLTVQLAAIDDGNE